MLFAAVFMFAAGHAGGTVTVTGDDGEQLTLETPAARIVSLAPHVTELLYAAGAGDRLVGAVAFSNYPEAALDLPNVGRYEKINLERVLELEPDLVIGWISGNPSGDIERLRELGLDLYMTNSVSLESVPGHLENIGALAGTADQGRRAATVFRKRLAALTVDGQDAEPVRVFYQVWNDPLFTINGEHLISEIIERCGGENVFAGLDVLAPRINVEAVLVADPEAIIASGMGEARPEWLDDWRRWPSLGAVAKDQLYFVHPDLIQRPTPRILEGMEAICEAIEKTRQSR